MQLVGFNRVKLSDIAKDLGVSHAALYGHFTDKSALFDAVSERWLNKLDSEQEKLCIESAGVDAIQRIIHWFLQLHRAKVAKVKHEPELFKALNYSTEAEKPFVKVHMSTMKQQLRALVSQAIHANLIKSNNIDATVSLLCEATIGFHHPAMVANHVNDDRESVLRELLQTLLNGLKA
jgi:AcrR family transcriptional regulator